MLCAHFLFDCLVLPLNILIRIRNTLSSSVFALFRRLSTMTIPKTIPMNMIVAVDASNGIAKDNSLPWHLPQEYKHFQSGTIKTNDPAKKNVVLMGRKCWESIPTKFRPLKNRINVVLSRAMPREISDDFLVLNDFDEAIRILTTTEPFASRVETIWNVGGKEVYALGLAHPLMKDLVITRIQKGFDTDVAFPEVDWENFERNDDFDGKEIEEKGLVYTINSYTRKTFGK
uniref:dihydrofolate reductase n=1 Tax=Panagrellus redivivus TaxID=6233 RepID=A0A7E4VQI5_PANRE